MTNITNDEQAENEHALDPREKWGQGTDASHPISAIDGVAADTPTADTGERDEVIPDEDENPEAIPDDLPLA